MRRVIGILALTGLLAGCAQNQFVGSLFYMAPYRLEDKTCAELKTAIATATRRADEQQELREKAARTAGGSAIGTIAYAPDYNRSAWDRELHEREYARKKCSDEPPPAPPPPGTTPPPSAPSTVIVPR